MYFFTSLPVSVVISADVISAMTSFPLSLGPMLTARDSDPPKKLGPRPPKKPPGQACHVTHIRLSDWSKFQILRSDWLVRILSHSSSQTIVILKFKLCLKRP